MSHTLQINSGIQRPGLKSLRVLGGTPFVTLRHRNIAWLLGIAHRRKNRVYTNFPILMRPKRPFTVGNISHVALNLVCGARIPKPIHNSRVCFASGLFVHRNRIYIMYGSADAYSYIWHETTERFMARYFQL